MKTFRCFAYFSTVLSFICVNTLTFAATLHVPADQPTIQAGIDAAKDGDTVLVADGTYSGIGNVNIDFLGKQIIVKSENGPEATIVDCQSIPNTRGFIFQNEETNDVVLEGFTITNGNHEGWGGIYCTNSAPTIKNCYILSNRGGIYCVDSNPKIIDSKISNNNSVAGVSFWGHPEKDYDDDKINRPRLTNCIVSENENAGISSFDGASVEIIGCIVSKNKSSGIVCDYFASVHIRYCEIFQNTGGGIKGTEYAGLNITDSIIKQNTAKNGGGISCSPTSRLKVIGCVIAENIATESGGGIDIYSSFGHASIAYCTITRNTANVRGGGVHVELRGSPFNCSNSIIWGNMSKGTHPEFFAAGPTVSIRSCDLRHGLEGFGDKWAEFIFYKDNIDEDPLFVNADSGDYRLRHNSPAITMGATAPREDLEEEEEQDLEEREDFIEKSLSVNSRGKRIVKWADLKRK
ncbi:hypothetical protein C6501_13830 [Candidatus Poribacteria bacterium]|nr:MAG: hypothetical protein C6501_13830 [Candidatus Poribacteria bacterium]